MRSAGLTQYVQAVALCTYLLNGSAGPQFSYNFNEPALRLEAHPQNQAESTCGQAIHAHDTSNSWTIYTSILLRWNTFCEPFRSVDQIRERASHRVTALDENLWAMNPKHDSLESLGSYLCLYADRFLKLANIACQAGRGTILRFFLPLDQVS